MSVSYDTAKSALAVAVRDTGAGMDEAQSSRLFQRFSQVDASSTRKHGGTGLGLAICKGLSEAMGGAISVTSRVMAGSIFEFTVSAPMVVEMPVDLAEAPEKGLDLEGLRLLVVDDNQTNREIVAALIGKLGVEVFEAASGPDGITVAHALPFDVILMDLRMPGMGGEEAARLIRSQPGPNQSVPILGFSADNQIKLGDYPDFDGLVFKPMILSELIDAIGSSLFEQSASISANSAGAA